MGMDVGRTFTSLGIFLFLIALALNLPSLNTFFIDFTTLSIGVVRVMQYGLMFTGFGVLMEAILE